MFSKKIILSTVLVSMAGLVACGDDSSSGSGDEDTLPEKVGSIQEVTSLKCNESVKCAKVFVEDGMVDDYFQCDGTQWQPATDTKFKELCPSNEKTEDESSSEASKPESSSEANKTESSSSEVNKTESSSSEGGNNEGVGSSDSNGGSSDSNGVSSDSGEDSEEAKKQAALVAELGICNESCNNVIDTTESKEVYICEWNDDAGLWRKLTSTELDSLAAKANKAAGEAFLDENKKKEGVITTASGLQYQIITEGMGATPTDNDTVKVLYTQKLLDGTTVSSSDDYDGLPEFTVNAVIDGWTELFKLMKAGSKVKAWIPSDLAYGQEGYPPSIPGNSVLVIEIELMDVKKAQ